MLSEQSGKDASIKAQADTIVQSFLQDKSFDAAQVAVLDGSKLVYTEAMGQIGSIKATSDMLIPLLDLSKTITAISVLQLVQNGATELQHKLFDEGGILEDITFTQAGTKPDKRVFDITIEDLLRHSAGWDEVRNPILDQMKNPISLSLGADSPDIGDYFDYEGSVDQYGIIQYMLTQPLTFTPGTKVVYSNLGYLILGRVVEALTGEPYEKYVKKNILDVAGMWHTQIGPSVNEIQTIYKRKFDQYGNLKHGAVDNFQPDMPFILDSTLGWYSTINDISRLFVTLFDMHNELLLQKQVLEQAISRLPAFKKHHPFSWPGLGMTLQLDGTILQESHDSDMGCNVLVYQESGCDFSMGESRGRISSANTRTVIFIGFTEHNRKHTIDVADNLLTLDFSGMSQNAFMKDMYDLELVSQSEDILLKSHLSEHHIVSYTNAMKIAGYYPLWIHGYSDKTKSYYVTVFAKAHKREQLGYKIISSRSKVRLWQFAAKHAKDGYQVTFLQSFVSASHGGVLTHTLIMHQESDQKVVLFDIFKKMQGEFMRQYTTHLKAEGFAPVVQSIDREENQLYMSYILQKAIPPASQILTKSYQQLNFDQLHQTTRRRVKEGYALSYIDAYVHLDGKPRFSCIYTYSVNVPTAWAIQTDIPSESLYSEAITWSMEGYLPKFIVAFTSRQSLYYVVYWEYNLAPNGT